MKGLNNWHIFELKINGKLYRQLSKYKRKAKFAMHKSRTHGVSFSFLELSLLNFALRSGVSPYLYCRKNHVLRRPLLHSKHRLTWCLRNGSSNSVIAPVSRWERLRQYISLLPLRKHPDRYASCYTTTLLTQPN